MISQAFSGEAKPRFPPASQPSRFPSNRSGVVSFPALGISTEMHCVSRRFSLSHSSLSKFNRAFAEKSIVRGWDIGNRSNSSIAASSSVADSDDVLQEPKKSQKKISKAERRMLLKSFVNSYRAMNSGKFPSATEAQREVGGGFYNVKKIIQEMEYESRLSSTSNLTRQVLKVEVNENKEQLKVKNCVGEVEQPQEVQLPGHETLVTELPLNDLSRVTFAEEKEVSELINISCEKYPVSDAQITNEEIDKSAHTHPNFVEAIEHPEEVQLYGQEAIVSKLYLNDVSSVTFAEGKEVSELKNLSCEKDRISVGQIKTEEIEKSAQTDSSDLSSLSAGPEPFKGDASVFDENDSSNNNVISSATDDKAHEIIRDTEIYYEKPVVPLTPEIAEDVKEQTVTINDHQLESSKMEEPARDKTKEHKNDVEPPKKSFGWNLKSIADGIVNFWRKW